MLKVGLTGGIGSGKSTVAALFRLLGIPVFDTDIAAKWIMEHDEALIDSIKNAFGEDAYIDHKLNRKYIADIVFKDKYQLEVLNSLTHPATIKAADDWMLQQNSPYCIKEAALFGKGLHVVATEAKASAPLVRDLLTEQGFNPTLVEQIVPSLEDVFVSLIEARDRLEKPMEDVAR